jgi:hypothetical protein
MDPASNWIALYPGTNLLRVTSSVSNLTYSISYNNRFGGL